VTKEKGRSVAARVVTDLLRIVRVVQIGGADFLQALVLGMADYEDAVQVAAALQIAADCLVTRNSRDYKGAPVRSARLAKFWLYCKQLRTPRDQHRIGAAERERIRHHAAKVLICPADPWNVVEIAVGIGEA
jgi:hypothetical protein